MTAVLGRDCGPTALCYCPVAEGANMSQQMDARNIVLSELQPGEVLRWSGQPTALAMLLSNAMNIGFGIVFAIVGGTPLGPFLLDGSRPDSIPLALFSSLFVFVGIGVAGKAIMEAIAAPWTGYAITDRRVLIVSKLFRKRVLTFGPNAINAIEFRENLLGWGNVVFRQEVQDTSDGKTMLRLAFVGIEDTVTAMRELQSLRDRTSPTARA